jgi:hypothetical protein
MSGKKVTAPCGHEGEHVLNNYVECLEGCDQPDSDEITLEFECPHGEYRVMHGPWTDTHWCAACGARLHDIIGKMKVTL